ncbi:LCP family protein [Streptomyces sp. x-80]|uniref:LCP family glycopolymer transferase n=1 Tax=Streptomyces sp. x-80 TaxID=2789282 RepID=UPI003980B68F
MGRLRCSIPPTNWAAWTSPPSKRHLKGEQALSPVRTRHGAGDGSDLGRIPLQRAFIKAPTQRIDGTGASSARNAPPEPAGPYVPSRSPNSSY